jgi:hypothetical protein
LGSGSLNYKEIVYHIVELDRLIKCVAIADIRRSKILETKYKEEVDYAQRVFLTRQKSEQLIIQSLIRMSTRTTLEHKLGRTLYLLPIMKM